MYYKKHDNIINVKPDRQFHASRNEQRDEDIGYGGKGQLKKYQDIGKKNATEDKCLQKR